MASSSFSLWTWDGWISLLTGKMYMPHGSCYLWQTPLVGLHLVANILIAIAYFSIPIMLFYFVKKRQNMPFSRVFILFGAFIIACGFGHLLDVVTLWYPIYWITGVEQIFTALISCYTAIELYTLLPQFLALKSPEELERINAQLQIEVQERQKTETILSRILEGTAAVTGQDFFPALVENLAIALDVKQVQITETLDPETGTEAILASWQNPKFIGEVSLIVPSEVPEIVPNAKTQNLRFPIQDCDQNPIGTLRIDHNQPTIDQAQATKLIAIFASRAAAEIERKRALDKLALAKTDLEAINLQLEDRVAKRTLDLKTTNQTLKASIEESSLVEEALRKSEERFRSLVLNIPGAVYRCLPDPQWTMQFLSHGITSMTGYEAEDFLNNAEKSFSEIIHPDDRQAIWDDTPEITPDSPTFNEEYRLICRDGQICWIYEQGQGIFDEQGQLVCIDGVMIDVTDRKLADQAIEQERQQLRQVIRNAPLPMAMFDPEMHYIAHSDQWLTAYGLEGQSIVGRSHYEVLPNLPEAWRKAHNRALNGEIVVCEEDKFERADGSVYYLKWKLQPWYKSENELGGIIRISQDISQLVEARETAIATSRLKSSFLANMSHEIRTPMNGILGIAELLKTTALTTQQKDFVRTLNNSANHLLYLINDILDFSKLEAGEMRLESIALHVVDCVESVAELLVSQAHHKKVELLTSIDSQLSQTLLGDPVRLRQILTNLAGNAVKFTHAGSVLMKAFPLEMTADKVTVRFEVIDTGIGIKEADQAKLFRSFSQVDPSTTREYGGTGLGLAIVRQLVTLMDGEVGLESVPDKGTTFWFTAILDRFEPNPCAIAIEPLPCKVLLLDSHPLSCEVLNDYLTAYGAKVRCCNSFVEGILALEQHQDFDLILFSLPLLGGQQEIKTVLQKISDLLPKEKLVLIFSNADYLLLKHWLQAEGIRYLHKPLQQQALFDCLQSNPLIEDIDIAAANLTEILNDEDGRSPKIKILLVEDTPINQTVIINQLLVLGFESVDCANNGREALEQLKYNHYDLVIMDCLMPELDGYSTTEIIRSQEQYGEHQLILAMTANAMKDDREKCLAVGMDDYISKPTTLNTLKEILQRLLKDKLMPTHRKLAEIEVESPQTLANEILADESSQKEVVDLSQLQLLYGDNLTFHFNMFQSFLSLAPDYLKGLHAAIASKDNDQITYQAHRLRGAVGAASITKIPVWCTKIETAIAEENYVEVTDLLAKIEPHFAQAIVFIQDYVQFLNQQLSNSN